MQDTYSSSQLQDYGRRLAARVCDAHFATLPVGATLDGPAVLKLTPVRQLNLFVVQQLLAQWTQEMANLRSPYFDYEDAAVRQALTQLMNLLSRRIRLTRATYEPLLAQAAADTLLAATDPAALFATKFVPAGQNSATAAQLRDALRYVEVNKPLFQSFIDALPADLPQERDYLLNRFRLHLDAHYKERQSVEQLLGELSPLLPVQDDDLREKKATTPAAEPVAAQPAPAPATPASTEAAAPAAAPTEQPSAAPVAAPAEPVAPPAPPKPEPKAPERAPLAAAAAPVSTLNDRLAAARTSTLHEKLAPQPTSTLAEAQPKVESLRSAISINQRFSFINELFNGENMEYHAAIEHLDALPTAEAARSYVNEDLTKRYQWVRKEEHVNKLLRLIDRKFA